MNKLLKVLRDSALTVGLGYLVLSGINNIASNGIEVHHNGMRVISKADKFNPFKYTSFYVTDEGTEGVVDGNLLTSRTMVIDYNPADGLVDRIQLRNVWLDRIEDYDDHREEFDRADKLLADAKRRFQID